MNKVFFKSALFFLLSTFAYPAFGQKVKKEAAILTFDNGTKVPKDEFEYVYQKNNGGWDVAKKHTPEEFKSYLDLYINFKRKVMEAESLKLHERPEFIQEYEGYRKQLAQPYLVDQKLQEQMILEAYERSQWMIKASHILVNCSPDASPEDTLKAYSKALELRDSVVKFKKDFAAVAGNNSSDPSAKKNGGDLGYFSVLDMVYPFESGAYNTPVGQISNPVRSGYGYHLIKVDDKQKTTGKKTASHIIVRVGPQYSAKDEAQAKTKIQEIHGKLKNGEAFADLALKFSDDQGTARKGGDLGNGRLIGNMEEVKMSLSKGQFSEPFQTNYGWHILTVTHEDQIKSFEQSKTELKSKVARDARATLSRESLIKKVKSEAGFSENKESIDKLNASVTDFSTYSKGFFRPEDSTHGAVYNLVLYTLGKGESKVQGTVRDFFNFYASYRKGVDASSVDQVTRKLLDIWYEQECLKFEEKELPKKYRDYRELTKEYRDGILLFTLTETMVWRKAVEDTLGLKEYYETNRESFTASERVVAYEYQSEDEKVLNRAKELLSKGVSLSEIDMELNATNSLNFKYRQMTFEKDKIHVGDPELFGKPVGHRTDIIHAGSIHRIYEVVEILPPGLRSYENSRSEAITRFQNHLEAEWLKSLEAKYPVKVDQKVLKKLYK